MEGWAGSGVVGETVLHCRRMAGNKKIMQASWKLAALALLLNFSVVSHGQDAKTAPSSSSPYTKLKSLSSALNGNWHLTGVYSGRPGGRSRLPFLSFAIEADETKIYGQGHVSAECQNSQQRLGAEYFTGRIASDGTFEANNYNDLSHLKFSIHGTMPAPGDTTWQGTYTLKSLSTEPDCIVDESGAFTATKYAPFSGTYSGTMTGNRFGKGEGVAVSAQVTQDEPGSYTELGFSIPMGGQITVVGLPCFRSGTATEKRTNRVEGDRFWLTFSMEDGALLHLSGNRFQEDSDESTIKDAVMSVEGGRCEDGLAGTLTRQ